MVEVPPEFSLAKFIAGVLGSFVSLAFLPGSALERFAMGVGGAALSYYASDPLAAWLAIPKIEGLIGLLIGLFGMAIVSKLYEIIRLVDAKRVSKDLWAEVKRKWKA